MSAISLFGSVTAVEKRKWRFCFDPPPHALVQCKIVVQNHGICWHFGGLFVTLPYASLRKAGLNASLFNLPMMTLAHWEAACPKACYLGQASLSMISSSPITVEQSLYLMCISEHLACITRHLLCVTGHGLGFACLWTLVHGLHISHLVMANSVTSDLVNALLHLLLRHKTWQDLFRTRCLQSGSAEEVH